MLPPRSERLSVGHPVDVVSGVVFTAWHDFEYPGDIPLQWRRFYQSADPRPTPLGRGWSSPFFMILTQTDSGFRLIDEEGGEVVFAAPSGGQPSIDYAAQMELHPSHDGWVIWYWHHRQWLIFRQRGPDGGFLLTRIADPSGNEIVLHYDAHRRLERLEQGAVGRTFHLTYGPDNLVREVELRVPGFNPRRLVTYEHDTLGRLTGAVGPAGVPLRYAYDDQHRLIRETNRLGGSFHFQYGPDGRCTRSWGDDRYLERTLEYDDTRGVTRVTDSLGATTTYVWRPDGGVARTVDPLGNAFEERSLGGVRQYTDPLGHTTVREFDVRGNLVRVVDPMGAEHRYTYDENDRCVRIVDPDGHEFKWEYDARGRLVSYENPLGEQSAFERGARGEIVRQVDAEGRILTRRLEEGMRWQEVADGRGYFRCEYDPWGRPVLISDPEGVREVFEADLDGRITVDRMPDGAQVDYTFDAEGNPVRFRYLSGSVWTFDYDRFGNVTRVTDPDGGTLELRYDTEGRRVALVNRRGEEHHDTYDANGRLIRRRSFDGRVEEYEYDAAGRLTVLRRADGSVLRRTYDARSNLTEETAQAGPGGEEVVVGTYTYNWAGRLLAASNPVSTIEFEYRADRKLVKEVQDGIEIHYRYDRGGRLIEREIAGGKVGPVRLEYDESGLLRTISDRHGSIQRLAYHPSGCVSRRTMRGRLEESFTYDAWRRLQKQEVRHGARSLVAREYAYDSSNNLAVKKDSLRGTFRWEYDSLLQLSQSARGGSEVEAIQHRWGRDIAAIGSTEFEYLPGGRLARAGAAEFAHDANGNVCERRAHGRTTRYAYDVKGRLTEAAASDGTAIQFLYDPLGRRVAKKAPGTELRFLWSGDTLAASLEEGNEPREYLVAYGSWRPSVQWIGDRAEHVICDALGTPQEIIDSHGAVVWWARYSAFGEAVEIGGERGRCHLRFPGQWEDPETGLHYNLHRYYDPRQTRYLTPDPIGLMGGVNAYDYARDPINWIDPMGLRCSNPKMIDSDSQGRWEIYEHTDGSLTIRADCSRAMSARPPGSDPVLRPTTHQGATNAGNFPEAYLGKDNNVIVVEGLHRGAAAARGAQIPRDPDNPHLGGVPNRPGWMEYHYDPNGPDGLPNDPNKVGIPLKDLQYPPQYPHKLPP